MAYAMILQSGLKVPGSQYVFSPALAGIAAGLAGVTNPVTGQPLKLDIIGFDACLMAMYEVGSVMAPYAHYLLASELLEPGTGWDYSSLGRLVKGTLWSGAAVNPAVGHNEADLADLLINSFMVRPQAGLVEGHFPSHCV